MNRQSNLVNRRHFLKKGTAGIAGAAFVPHLISTNRQEKAQKDRKFIYRTLGKTGFRLPVISMGVMNASNPHLVRAALDSGLIHLDTAWGYQRGRNEEMIGEVIKDRPRGSYVIGTKVWEPRDRETGLFPKDATADTFNEKFETSLRRLGLDYVDILYLHNINVKESVTFEPYLNAMVQLKKEGKARFLGITTHQNEPVIIREATDCGVYDVILTAYNFRQTYYKDIEKEVERAAKKGIGIVGMKAIAGGLERGARIDNAGAKAALKWAVRNENFHTNIPGFTTFDQLETDLTVMEDLEFSPDEEKFIKMSMNRTGLYCQQCGACRSQCPAGVDIPTLMRSYMYVAGYKNLQAAREALDSIDLSSLECKACDPCRVKCTMGYDVRKRALAVTGIRDIPEDYYV